MKKTTADIKIAELSAEDMEAIRTLEKRLGDICLIAVKKGDALYALEAKMAPNVWEPVDKVYPEIENLKAYYADEDAAKLSKGALKSYLIASKKYKGLKRPIRIKKIN